MSKADKIEFEKLRFINNLKLETYYFYHELSFLASLANVE
jgi:hypothetical protein